MNISRGLHRVGWVLTPFCLQFSQQVQIYPKSIQIFSCQRSSGIDIRFRMQKMDLVVDVELKLVTILFKKPLVKIRHEQSAKQRHHTNLFSLILFHRILLSQGTTERVRPYYELCNEGMD
jgi:hypothetical protein